MIVKKKPICGYSNRIAMILMLVSHGNRCQYISSETFTFGTIKKPTCVQISRHKSFGQTPRKNGLRSHETFIAFRTRFRS